MATYFSYADTVLRAIYINTHLKESEEDIQSINAALSQFDRLHDYKTDLARRNISKQLEDAELSSLYCHEAHHYWQTFFYPFLYYICWQEYRIMMGCRRYLRYNKDHDQLPFQPNLLSEEELHTIQYTTNPFRLVWQNQRLYPELETDELDITDPDVFCLVDLLEDATTLFQFKCLHHNPEAHGYSNWVNNPKNKGYKRLYKFFRSRLGEAAAYHLLPVWVQLAFSSTEPIGSFCNFVNFTVVYELTDLPAAELYTVLKELYLSKEPVTYFKPADYLVIEKTPVTFFDEGLFRETINDSAVDLDYGHYPLSMHGKKWLQLAHEIPDFTYYIVDPNPQRLAYLFEQFYPYLTFFNFMDFEGRKNAIFIPPDYNDAEFIYHDRHISYKNYLPEILKKKEIITSILTDHNLYAPHNCHHQACPYYPTQLCRRWNAIPRNAPDCAFPLWFATEFFYEIDLERRCLQRIDQQEIDRYKRAYADLFSTTSRKLHVQYTRQTDGSFLLLVPKTIIEKGQISYFTDFLALAAQDHALAGNDFFNKVVFDFPDYSSADRFLFDIPAVVRWFQSLKKEIPHFFLYPSMAPEDKQGFILLPMFIQHQAYDAGNGNSRVRFDPEELMQFALEETVAMGTWFERQQTDGEPYLLSFWNYIKHSI